MDWSTVGFMGCIVWALVVGTSVTAQVCITATLNGQSDQPQLHAYYISNIGFLLGGSLLIPRCILNPKPCHKPVRWWSACGGIFTLPAFLSIPASRLVGAQVVLLTQLMAMLGTALLFDLRKGRLRLTDYKRLGGFLVVILGVLVENSGGKGGDGFSVTAVLLLLGVFLSGVGYALQAKCNGRLSKDDSFGSTARSTAFSNLVSIVSGLPMFIVVAAGFHVAFHFSWSDWPSWLFVGFQSAFYVASLARLPGYLGYTTSFLVLLVGKLASSSVADSLGATGTVVPFSVLRGIALLMVFAGTALFSDIQLCKQPEPEPALTASMIASLDPAFEDPGIENEESELAGEARMREAIASGAEASGAGAQEAGATDHA